MIHVCMDASEGSEPSALPPTHVVVSSWGIEFVRQFFVLIRISAPMRITQLFQILGTHLPVPPPHPSPPARHPTLEKIDEHLNTPHRPVPPPARHPTLEKIDDHLKKPQYKNMRTLSQAFHFDDPVVSRLLWEYFVDVLDLPGDVTEQALLQRFREPMPPDAEEIVSELFWKDGGARTDNQLVFLSRLIEKNAHHKNEDKIHHDDWQPIRARVAALMSDLRASGPSALVNALNVQDFWVAKLLCNYLLSSMNLPRGTRMNHLRELRAEEFPATATTVMLEAFGIPDFGHERIVTMEDDAFDRLVWWIDVTKMDAFMIDHARIIRANYKYTKSRNEETAILMRPLSRIRRYLRGLRIDSIAHALDAVDTWIARWLWEYLVQSLEVPPDVTLEALLQRFQGDMPVEAREVIQEAFGSTNPSTEDEMRRLKWWFREKYTHSRPLVRFNPWQLVGPRVANRIQDLRASGPMAIARALDEQDTVVAQLLWIYVLSSLELDTDTTMDALVHRYDDTSRASVPDALQALIQETFRVDKLWENEFWSYSPKNEDIFTEPVETSIIPYISRLVWWTTQKIDFQADPTAQDYASIMRILGARAKYIESLQHTTEQQAKRRIPFYVMKEILDIRNLELNLSEVIGDIIKEKQTPISIFTVINLVMYMNRTNYVPQYLDPTLYLTATQQLEVLPIQLPDQTEVKQAGQKQSFSRVNLPIKYDSQVRLEQATRTSSVTDLLDKRDTRVARLLWDYLLESLNLNNNVTTAAFLKRWENPKMRETAKHTQAYETVKEAFGTSNFWDHPTTDNKAANFNRLLWWIKQKTDYRTDSSAEDFTVMLRMMWAFNAYKTSRQPASVVSTQTFYVSKDAAKVRNVTGLLEDLAENLETDSTPIRMLTLMNLVMYRDRTKFAPQYIHPEQYLPYRLRQHVAPYGPPTAVKDDSIYKDYKGIIDRWLLGPGMMSALAPGENVPIKVCNIC